MHVLRVCTDMDAPIHPLVIDLQARMFANRLKPGNVVRQAGLNPSTWWRWTKGAEPKLSTLKAVSETIDRLTA